MGFKIPAGVKEMTNVRCASVFMAIGVFSKLVVQLQNKCFSSKCVVFLEDGRANIGIGLVLGWWVAPLRRG